MISSTALSMAIRARRRVVPESSVNSFSPCRRISPGPEAHGCSFRVVIAIQRSSCSPLAIPYERTAHCGIPKVGSLYPERCNVSLISHCSVLSGVLARLPDLRITMAVQDSDDCHLRLADHVENAVRKPLQQCPADFPVNPGICQRVLPDPAQARVESLPELRSQAFTLISSDHDGRAGLR